MTLFKRGLNEVQTWTHIKKGFYTDIDKARDKNEQMTIMEIWQSLKNTIKANSPNIGMFNVFKKDDLDGK